MLEFAGVHANPRFLHSDMRGNLGLMGKFLTSGMEVHFTYIVLGVCWAGMDHFGPIFALTAVAQHWPNIAMFVEYRRSVS